MKRLLLLAPIPVLVFAAVLLGDEKLRAGKYRKPAAAKTLRLWDRHYRTKKGLVPSAPRPLASEGAEAATDFSGSYRFGRYDYDVVIEQVGDRVTFRSGGVDRQDIGGAFETVGIGTVADGRLRARWWCFDLSRNYANNGGCEMWFHREGDRNRLWVRYYHDADEAIEEGWGVRHGMHEGERLHYRIRMRRKTRKFDRPVTLFGSVRGRGGEAIRDAVVMLRHDEESAVRTDAAGRWRLPIREMPYVLTVSAAARGYRTQVQALLVQERRPLHFVLDTSPHGDDARYRFVDPTPNRQVDIWNCGNCHKNSYAEWNDSRHALAAKNAVTRAVYRRDFLPALADGSASGDPGLCAACHAPQAALEGRATRLDEVTGVALFGNHCDFCHKVHHTDALQAPGVRGSLRLGRPAPDDESVPGPIKRIYGALADSDYLFMGAVYNPFFATSALCAGCHQYRTAKDIPALDTYAEWRAWAKDRRRHESCQSCHMPTGTSMEGRRLARRICVNALRRPQEQIHDHGFLGRDLASTTVDLAVNTRLEGDRLEVTTSVSAVEAGHKVPTGSGDKHLLLVVLAADGAGRPYALVEGARVPPHAGGSGDATRLDAATLRHRLAEGDFAGMPGREFAQVLADRAGRTHVPFWRAVRVVEDTRLVPDVPVALSHVFAVSGGRAVTVQVEVWHRLRYKRDDVARDVKGPTGVRPLDLLLATSSVDVR
ncbi:MAG: multiheme c-type cytochrome [Planctomycetota bacterium]|jgi:hypothetical protein